MDTCVLAEVRHPQGDPRVRAVVAGLAPDSIFLSVLTLGEVSKGIDLLPAGKKKRELTEWLNGLDQMFPKQILPVDCETALLWGQLTARAQLQGAVIPAPDGLIAATALRHGLTVLTRNTKRFSQSGASVVDPWAD